MYNRVQSLLSESKSHRQISRELGINRRTVKKLSQLDIDEACEYFKKGVQRRSGFDIARSFIEAKLRSYPGIRSSNLYHQVKDSYPEISLGERSFRLYMRKLKASMVLPCEKRRYFEPVVSWTPGEYMQVDLGEKSVVLSDQSRMKVHFISFVVCYSRMMYIHYSTRAYNTDMFIAAHLAAFQYFNGIPQAGIYDQTKLVAISEEYREVLYNERFQRLFLSLGFRAEVCEGYDPQSKGMVEKSIDYIKESFLHGREFKGIDDLRRASEDWLTTVANVREHQTTLQQPIALMEEEQAVLKTLGQDLYPSQIRKVDKTGLISYQGRSYSVPYQYQQQQVLVRAIGAILKVYDQQSDELLAEWNTNECRGRINKNENHYVDYKRSVADELALSIEMFTNRQLEQFVPIIKRIGEDYPKQPRAQYRGMRSLLGKYDPTIWQAEFANISSLPVLSCKRIKRLLELRRSQEEQIKVKYATPVSTGCIREKNKFRDMSYYDYIAGGLNHG